MDIHVKQMTISCSTAYGPQENDIIRRKKIFWEYLSGMTVEAEKDGKRFLLQGLEGADLQKNKINK